MEISKEFLIWSYKISYQFFILNNLILQFQSHNSKQISFTQFHFDQNLENYTGQSWVIWHFYFKLYILFFFFIFQSKLMKRGLSEAKLWPSKTTLLRVWNNQLPFIQLRIILNCLIKLVEFLQSSSSTKSSDDLPEYLSEYISSADHSFIFWRISYYIFANSTLKRFKRLTFQHPLPSF